MAREDNILKTIKRMGREASLNALRNVGNVNRSKTFESRKDKANDPRRQRKQQSWRSEL
jgi:hypothetical protein